MAYEFPDIKEAVSEAREKGVARDINFEQSFDTAVNFRTKEIDMSDPENRFNEELILPNDLYPPSKVAAFGDGEFAENAKTAGVSRVISKDEIAEIGEDKSKQKAVVKEFDFFIAARDAMPLVGRYLGQLLGPRGKMPKPYPPEADLGGVVEQYQRTVRIRMRNTPTFHVKVGHERMGDEQIAENTDAVIDFVRDKGLARRIDSVYVKTTMGPAIEVPR